MALHHLAGKASEENSVLNDNKQQIKTWRGRKAAKRFASQVLWSRNGQKTIAAHTASSWFFLSCGALQKFWLVLSEKVKGVHSHHHFTYKEREGCTLDYRYSGCQLVTPTCGQGEQQSRKTSVPLM